MTAVDELNQIRACIRHLDHEDVVGRARLAWKDNIVHLIVEIPLVEASDEAFEYFIQTERNGVYQRLDEAVLKARRDIRDEK